MSIIVFLMDNMSSFNMTSKSELNQIYFKGCRSKIPLHHDSTFFFILTLINQNCDDELVKFLFESVCGPMYPRVCIVITAYIGRMVGIFEGSFLSFYLYVYISIFQQTSTCCRPTQLYYFGNQTQQFDLLKY